MRKSTKNKSKTSSNQTEPGAPCNTKKSAVSPSSIVSFVKPSACTHPSTLSCVKPVQISPSLPLWPPHLKMELTSFQRVISSSPVRLFHRSTHCCGGTRSNGTRQGGQTPKVWLSRRISSTMMRMVKRLTLGSGW